MSTVAVKMYTLVCDGCGADVNEGTDFAAYAQEFASREIADDQGWLTTLENGRDWCPDCCEWEPDGNDRRPTALPAQRLLALQAPLHKERA